MAFPTGPQEKQVPVKAHAFAFGSASKPSKNTPTNYDQIVPGARLEGDHCSSDPGAHIVEGAVLQMKPCMNSANCFSWTLLHA